MRPAGRACRAVLPSLFDSMKPRHSFSSGSISNSVRLFLPLQQGETDPSVFHPISGKFPSLLCSASARST